ncbi:hypothetical protein [Haloarcula sp. Atlit-7R]|nr:hypothetical protein [Haloarcula sp. Atlit-7R]
MPALGIEVAERLPANRIPDADRPAAGITLLRHTDRWRARIKTRSPTGI